MSTLTAASCLSRGLSDLWPGPVSPGAQPTFVLSRWRQRRGRTERWRVGSWVAGWVEGCRMQDGGMGWRKDTLLLQALVDPESWGLSSLLLSGLDRPVGEAVGAVAPCPTPTPKALAPPLSCLPQPCPDSRLTCSL